MPPLECCLRGFAALSGPRFGVVKRGEVAQKWPEALRARFLWHTLRALESGTVIQEMKDGAYEPIGAGNLMER